MPQPNDQPRLAPGCRISEASEQPRTLLFPEGALKLNATGARILAYCDGQRSVQDIIAALVDEFEGADRPVIENEVNTFLEQLRARGAVRF